MCGGGGVCGRETQEVRWLGQGGTYQSSAKYRTATILPATKKKWQMLDQEVYGFGTPRFADFSLRKTRGFFTYFLAPFLTNITLYIKLILFTLIETNWKICVISKNLSNIGKFHHLFLATEKMSVLMLFEICFCIFDILYITFRFKHFLFLQKSWEVVTKYKVLSRTYL